ncbi:hypothetical protein SESBI_45322 [Sesbania bispinosa]|nr:hypothetical protein SESBI_45322 [Sesbania bispinosa]
MAISSVPHLSTFSWCSVCMSHCQKWPPHSIERITMMARNLMCNVHMKPPKIMAATTEEFKMDSMMGC